MLGGRLQASARCVWLINTQQYRAVQRNIYYFSIPHPPAALKSHFPTIWCKILVLDGFSVVCGVTSPVSWAAVDWNNPTPLRSFSLKSHPASCSEGWQGGGHSGQACPLKILTLSPVVLWVLKPLSAGMPTVQQKPCFLQLLISLSSLNADILVINTHVNECFISCCLCSLLIVCSVATPNSLPSWKSWTLLVCYSLVCNFAHGV